MSGQSVVVRSAIIHGMEAVPVGVEVSVSGGLPGINIVGMPSSTVLESRTRVRCAIREAGFTIPRLTVNINLAPGDMRKTGTGLDLPIAVGILAATGQIPATGLEQCLVVGELGLHSLVCPVRGMAAYQILARDSGLTLVTGGEGLELPVDGTPLRMLNDLADARGGLTQLEECDGHVFGGAGVQDEAAVSASDLDFEDVVDQEMAKRALVIAAAGNHGLIMVGPPGAGKTMLARRVPSILPAMSPKERAEAILVHSVAGQSVEQLLAGERPFRAPHHSISMGGLIGGGKPVIPGEVSLAHNGVLFLDELPEFAKNVLQSLRQPIEDHEVRLVRVDGVYTFPCDFTLLAAANPCPCGHYGDPGHECTCPPSRINAYQARIGGPLMNRIDVFVDVHRPDSSRIIQGETGMSSAQMAEQVMRGRQFASWREARAKKADEQLTGVDALGFDAAAKATFTTMAANFKLGGRSITKISRVARTIADLDERERVTSDDVFEALGYRSRDLSR